jgi:hypothetical protein
MSYNFPAPEYYPSVEESKLEVLKTLSDGCWLADTVHKESPDTQTVLENQHPAFFAKANPYFDHPDPELLNEMIRDGLLSVEISANELIIREHPLPGLRVPESANRSSGDSLR